jgi:hypothetical protein
MFLHLIIAAALFSPGSDITASASPVAAMVCSIAAEIAAPHQGARRNAPEREHAFAMSVAQARPLHQDRLTTQLRR